MEANNVSNRFYLFALAIAVMCFIAIFKPCHGGEADDVTLKAYELRMQGKVDEAKTLLEQAISDGMDNAQAGVTIPYGINQYPESE